MTKIIIFKENIVLVHIEIFLLKEIIAITFYEFMHGPTATSEFFIHSCISASFLIFYLFAIIFRMWAFSI